MKRYKGYSDEQGTMVTVLFKKQIVPGTFENTLHHLIDSELDEANEHQQSSGITVMALIPIHWEPVS